MLALLGLRELEGVEIKTVTVRAGSVGGDPQWL